MPSLLESIRSLFVIQLVLVISYGSINVSASSSTTMEEIEKYLEKINKPAVKSIKSPDGDIIDCIPIDKQAAFDNPLLKNHNIQMVPSTLSTYRSGYYSTVRQVWNDAGSCPNGTVPIRRTTMEDVLRAESLSQFGKKLHMHSSINPASPPSNHEYAVADYTQDPVYGTKATFNIWDAYVEVDDEFSLSQLWITAGSYKNSDLNTIESGWQVYPGLYGDKNARLFIYWTRDAYNSTGCYNHVCSGFVQTDTSVVIGGALSPVSTYGGTQYEMTILIWKDPRTGNWWLKVEDTNVGYWPSELFTHLSSNATTVQWGGEIVDIRTNGVHTSTDMGSGYFPEEGYKKASYIRNLTIVNSSNELWPAQHITTIVTNATCYSVTTNNSTNWGVSFFFGGPGKNPNCP